MALKACEMNKRENERENLYNLDLFFSCCVLSVVLSAVATLLTLELVAAAKPDHVGHCLTLKAQMSMQMWLDVPWARNAPTTQSQSTFASKAAGARHDLTEGCLAQLFKVD